MLIKQKIKVLFVLNHFEFLNGVASTLRSLIENIDNNRFEIHVLPLYNLDKKFADTVEGKFFLHRGIGFYFRGLSKIVGRIPLKVLYKLFVREKYDLEVAYQFGDATRILSVSTNPNKICWMHGYDKYMKLRTFYKKYNRIISVAKIGSDKLKQEGFLNSDYCYNIIDETKIYNMSLENSHISKNAPITIINVCRIEPDKACLRLIKCFYELHKTYSNFEFLLIGDGSEMPKIKEFIETNNMSSYIKLLGSQPNPFKFVKAADLFFNGSLHEGFNTACQEAAILGIPVMTTNVDGARELIELTGCGRVTDNNEDGIKTALADILSDPSILESWKLTAERNKIKLYKQARIEKIEQVLIKSYNNKLY